MTNKIHVLSILFFLLCFSACNRDEINGPNTSFTSGSGIYILSEGTLSASSAKLSYYNFNTGSYQSSIFAPGNLGLFPDGMILFSGKLYITEQGNYGSAGKIYKTDTNGIVQNFSNAGINPYSLAGASGKLYITNGPSNSVTVLDANTFALIKTINTGLYPQEIIAIGDRVFVCNTGYFGGAQDSTVTVIDATTDNVIYGLKIRPGLKSAGMTKENKLLIGCQGANGLIFTFDPTTLNKLDSFNLTDGFSNDFGVDYNAGSDDVYFISFSNNIMKLNLSNRSVNNVISNPNLSANFFYGYNFDWVNRKHYIANAFTFTTYGKLQRYSYSGNPETVFDTGIAPRRIVFKF